MAESESDTVELDAVTDEEADAEAWRRQRPEPVVCTDPAYVVYLERVLQIARDEAESARAVFAAVGAHNAELSTEVAGLRGDVQRLMNQLLATQWELLQAEALAKRKK